MRKLVLICILCLLSIFMFAQERINAPQIKFEKISEKIDSCSGWYFTVSGNWIENDKLIDYEKEQVFEKNIEKRFIRSNFEQNFIFLMTAKLIVDNNNYYAFIVVKHAGYYAYPTLQLDWISRKEIQAFSLTADEFKKIKYLKTTELIKSYNCVSMSYENEVTQENLNSIAMLLANVIKMKKDLKDKYQNKIYWPIKKTRANNTDVIRFLLPIQYSLSNKIEDFNFDKKYFEISTDIFNRLFID